MRNPLSSIKGQCESGLYQLPSNREKLYPISRHILYNKTVSLIIAYLLFLALDENGQDFGGK